MNITGKRLGLYFLLLMTATLWLGLFFVNPLHPQDTTSLEAECVVVASASSTIVPATLTPQEYCKALVALLGNEWLKAAKLEAIILVVTQIDTRLEVAETTIIQLQADVAALQAQTSFQPQIDVINSNLVSINTKLTNMAVALQ